MSTTAMPTPAMTLVVGARAAGAATAHLLVRSGLPAPHRPRHRVPGR